MGFILNDLKDFFSPDKRWTRVMAGPHHNVMLNVANVQNTFYGPNAVLKMNTGLQSNLRMEDEGGGKISLNMHLISVLNTLRWEKPLGNSNTLILANQLAYENNTNYGGRILIPDANMAEGGLSGFVRLWFERGVLEAGLSGNLRYIQTLPTRSLNLSSDEVKPLSTLRKAVNGILGFSFNPSKGFNLKSSFSTGFRAPNLAELSCNGLREGSYRYEIGNAKLKNEQNLCLDLTMEAKSMVLSVYVSAFANRFLNYIFIAPTVEQFYGFPVFRYSQANSLLYGGEAVFNLSPNQLKWWQWKNAFSIVFGKLDNGGNLPYIPAPKVVSSFRFEKMLLKKIRNLFLEPEAVMVLQQHRPAEFETATPAYWLLNCAAGFSFPLKSREMNISIVGQNLLNTAYADHLSRIKYFGMLNIGRNIMMRVQVTF
jgi:iron complex outermembrane receptor protein